MKLSRIGLLLILISSAYAEEKQLEPKQEAARIVRVIKDNYGWASSGLVGLGASIALGMVKGRYEKFENDQLVPLQDKMEALEALPKTKKFWANEMRGVAVNLNTLKQEIWEKAPELKGRQTAQVEGNALVVGCMNAINEQGIINDAEVNRLIGIHTTYQASAVNVSDSQSPENRLKDFRSMLMSKHDEYLRLQREVKEYERRMDIADRAYTKLDTELSVDRNQINAHNIIKPQHIRRLFYASIAVAAVSLLYGAYKIGKYLWKRASAHPPTPLQSIASKPEEVSGGQGKVTAPTPSILPNVVFESVAPPSVASDKSLVEIPVENNFHPEPVEGS